jgi:hypothetical protein
MICALNFGRPPASAHDVWLASEELLHSLKYLPEGNEKASSQEKRS